MNKPSLSVNWSRILPNYCTLCGERAGTENKSLCSPCSLRLPWLINGCRYCSYPVSQRHNKDLICGSCQQHPPPFHRSYCLFRYAYPIDRLITQLKFGQQLPQGQLLGRLLADFIQNQIPANRLPDALIPMPLHKHRLRQRGFNQAFEIAQVCAKTLHLPLAYQLCQRIKNTPAQINLDAKTRQRNLRGAFKVNAPLDYQSVAIVDDVITTGSSMRELSTELIEAGVRRVDLWSIARTTLAV